MGENVKSENDLYGALFENTLKCHLRTFEQTDYKSNHCLIFVATLSGGNGYETDLVLKKFVFN